MKYTIQCCGRRVSNTVTGDWIYVDRRKENSGFSGAFCDPRVIMVTPFDERLAVIPRIDSKHCEAHQNQSGPTYLVIGPNVTDDSLLRASTTFGIPLKHLMAFRASNEDITKLPIWRPVVAIVAPDGAYNFETLGEPMPKQKAWKIARAAMDSRREVVLMSVRRERDTRFEPEANGTEARQRHRLDRLRAVDQNDR